ncbi:MAG: cation-transporting P-type ATPase [Thermoleophilia bacterium]
MAIPVLPGLRRGTPVAAAPGPRMQDVACVPGEQVLQQLGTTPDGLSAQEAAARLRTHRPNVLRVHRVTALAVLGAQLRNPLLILLLAAAALGDSPGTPPTPPSSG